MNVEFGSCSHLNAYRVPSNNIFSNQYNYTYLAAIACSPLTLYNQNLAKIRMPASQNCEIKNPIPIKLKTSCLAFFNPEG